MKTPIPMTKIALIFLYGAFLFVSFFQLLINKQSLEADKRLLENQERLVERIRLLEEQGTKSLCDG
jgi:hypothetical protein